MHRISCKTAYEPGQLAGSQQSQKGGDIDIVAGGRDTDQGLHKPLPSILEPSENVEVTTGRTWGQFYCLLSASIQRLMGRGSGKAQSTLPQ